ncbi:PfkB family carbohydrate kinase [Methanobrevibacter olleyae]|uniref:Carbohydrate kinase PfkB family n=1 Tax=Methanobrevibacter olleyae TaxID=294671 RepID=A0A126QZU7_METOL|nr:PfkB family carbohydrate kinase [Methanobrevibacter olleyae]AMK15368.1 carbohydrate kinase PfkB family [Methanobrevibacter olleyae]SFL70396.1 pfkB family carbohydrate kinase [Methanobrevibacter olleyae]
MTLVLIGPVCEDLIIIGDEKSSKVGGASFYQSFVYEEFYDDYLSIINTSNTDLIDKFPDKSKVKVILKEDTHYFINEYPDKDNLNIRKQFTNFANVPIFADDLKAIFDELDMNNGNIDAFVLNPLNSNDFPQETIEYLKSFELPIFVSIQGFLRFKGENDSIILKYDEGLDKIISCSEGSFMDEEEAKLIPIHNFNRSPLIITNGSKGSRILYDGNELKIEAVNCDNMVDATGCGDTYMASYISFRLKENSIKDSADFASLISSKKLETFGPFKKYKK